MPRKNQEQFPFDDLSNPFESETPPVRTQMRPRNEVERTPYSYSVSSEKRRRRKKAIARWSLIVMVLILVNILLVYAVQGVFSNGDSSASSLPANSGAEITLSSEQTAVVTTPVSEMMTSAEGTTVETKASSESPLALLPPSNENPVIALTFDDGPSSLTPALLDVLKEKDVKATFFLLGTQMENLDDAIVKRIVDEGHELGNHSYNHPILTNGLTADEIRSQLTRTSNLAFAASGQYPTVFRPPTGAWNDTVLSIAKELNMYTVNWAWQSCPEDWEEKNKDPAYLSDFVVNNAGNGHVVLLHDIHEATVQSIPDMIDGLREKGYRFATVSELMQYNKDGYELGVGYYLADM